MLICLVQSVSLLVVLSLTLGLVGSRLGFFLDWLALAGVALCADQVDHHSDDSEGVPERGVLEDGERGDTSEDLVLLDPQQQGESEEGRQLEGPAVGEEQHCGSEQADNNKPEVLLQQFLNVGSEPITASHGVGELLVKGSDGLLVRVDEVGFEDDRGDDESLSEEGSQAHLYSFPLKFINKLTTSVYTTFQSLSVKAKERQGRGKDWGYTEIRDDHGKMRSVSGFTPSYTTQVTICSNAEAPSRLQQFFSCAY